MAGVIGITAIKSINILGLPLFLDEGNYIFWAKLVHENIGFAYISLQDGKTPLFIWLISLFNSLFKNYLFTGRIISILAGGITLLSWSYISHKLFPKISWLGFGVLMLVCPYLLLIEKMALADSLLTSFASLSMVFWTIFHTRLIGSSRIKPLLSASFLSGVFLGLGFMVKSSARIFLVAEFAVATIIAINLLFHKQFKKIVILVLGALILFGTYHEIIGYMRVGAHSQWSTISEKEAGLTFPIKRIITAPDLHHYSILAPKEINYFLVYIGPILILTICGGYIILRNRPDLLWLLVYTGVIVGGVALSGKVAASRYFYPSVPPILLVSSLGLEYLRKKSRLGKYLVYGMLIFAGIQSTFMLAVPLKALYAPDDSDYFVRGDLSALGLPEVITYLKTQQDVHVGVSGVWGVAEGTILILEENNIKASKIPKVDQLDNNGNFNYLYLTSQDDIHILPNPERYEIVLKFTRPNSNINTYLLKYVYSPEYDISQS